ncbi:hypothetical protein VTO42DRAFT_3887 [Malbranchea cinnamomea]
MSTAEKSTINITPSEESSHWEKSKQKFQNKPASEYHDPCQDFANRSIRCLRRNGGDKDLCSDYFQAYRDCKKAWMTERKFSKK